MRQIRVLLASLPTLLEEIVDDAIERREDMTVVGRLASADAALAELPRLEPDAVVLGLSPGETVEMRRALLDARPRMKILGVAPDGREIDLFELRSVVTPLGDTSPDDLVEVIRGALG